MSKAVRAGTTEIGLLRKLSQQLVPGQSIAIMDKDGNPIGLFTSLVDVPREKIKWIMDWQELAEDVSQSWDTHKTAVELVSEGRR